MSNAIIVNTKNNTQEIIQKETFVDLQFVKTQRKLEIKTLHEQEMISSESRVLIAIDGIEPFEVNARRIDLDNFIQLRDFMIDSLILSVQIRCFDNSFKTLTLDQLKSMIAQMRASGLQKYQIRWAKEAQIDAAMTPEEVYAVTW